eukprot:14224513-Ditylum_brightwellii.AAC.1
MLPPPSLLDSPELYNFNSHARLCHEVLNSHMWNFNSLSDTWRHGAKKVGITYDAVAVIIQYQFDNS